MADTEATKDIESEITRALAKRGVAGSVVVRENIAELHGSGHPVVAIDLEKWVEQWNLLPPEIRVRRADRAASRLQAALAGGSEPKIGRRRTPISGFVKKTALVFAIVGGASGTFAWLYTTGFFGGTPEPSPTAETSVTQPETVQMRKERLQRSCEASRKRIYAGAAMGLDAEGWVVELWLARKAPGLFKSLNGIEKSKWITEIGVKDGAHAALVNRGSKQFGLEAVAIQLSKAYAPAFFTKAGRKGFITAAAAISEQTKADYAALYAGCAHTPEVHDVGAWFFGRDDGKAVASLLFNAGAFSHPPIIKKANFGKEGAAARLGVLDVSAADLDDVLRSSGAKVQRAEGGGTTFAFFLGGPTRPQLASRKLVKKMGYDKPKK